jgi:hypothetical protein
MNARILNTRPERLTYLQLTTLHGNAVLRDRYNHRWNVAFC